MKNLVHTSTALLGAAIALSATLSAQTFTVGPGGSFTSLAVATSTVPSGSVLIVDPGVYQPFSIINKALTIVCSQSGQRISVASTATAPAFVVRGVPAGEVCLVSDVDVQWADQQQPAVRALDNFGDLYLDRISVSATMAHLATPASGAVSIDNCAVTWMTECAVNTGNDFPACRVSSPPSIPGDRGMPAVWVAAADLVVDRSHLRGFDYPDVSGRGGPAIRTSGTGVRVRIFGPELRPYSLRGGDGGQYGGDVLQHLSPAQPGVEVCGYGTRTPGVGALGSGGDFAIDSDRGIAGAGLQRVIPACILDLAAHVYNANTDGFVQLGGSLNLEFWSFTPQTALLYLDSALDLSLTVPTGLPGISMLGWAGAALLAGPFAMAGGTSTQAFVMPGTPSLLGLRFGVQLVTAPSSGVVPAVVPPGDIVVVQ